MVRGSNALLKEVSSQIFLKLFRGIEFWEKLMHIANAVYSVTCNRGSSTWRHGWSCSFKIKILIWIITQVVKNMLLLCNSQAIKYLIYSLEN